MAVSINLWLESIIGSQTIKINILIFLVINHIPFFIITRIYGIYNLIRKFFLHHGITVINGAYYYQGVRIRIFMDLRENKSFETFSFDKEGTVDIRLIRSKNNSIKKIEYLTKEEADEILSDFEDSELDGQTEEQHTGVITRLAKEELPKETMNIKINIVTIEKIVFLFI